ncbi:MAG: hypothetical protein EDM05_043420 [Leptolyngbya sp. IPPAS B-1204]|nr:hypothetical protein [Elainella sp. C42_A2020_010]RNJ69580.1 MAG: hypothetical protein EDM05_10020 [Leptolyngbya sp. IPPAS B-1204]
MPIQRTIELPDHLAKRLDEYLQQHPEETLSSLVIRILETQVQPNQLSELLESSNNSAESANKQGLPACVGMGASGRGNLSENDEQLLWQEEWRS